MTLPLYGTATKASGLTQSGRTVALRLASTNKPPASEAHDAVLARNADELLLAAAEGFKRAVLITDDSALVLPGHNTLTELITLPSRFAYLADGDVLGFDPRSQRFRVLYRKASQHNSFLVTERCNNYCLMCSQPPRRVDDGWILDEIRQAVPLVDKETRSLGFTGGEPLSDWREFIDVLHLTRDELPQTGLHVLTNGRAFARPEVASAWADISHPDLMVGIPIYASVDHVHDYVVQAHGAFDETVLGILRLKDRGQRVEVRVVLHAITAPDIDGTCNWIARNLPFVDHVALMGLENTGFAIANESQLWIDPVDYADELARGVSALEDAKVNVSVYNLPKCLLPRSVWPRAVQSISDWKKRLRRRVCGMH